MGAIPGKPTSYAGNFAARGRRYGREPEVRVCSVEDCHSVPEHLLARIGDITVSFALLESVLQLLAYELIGQGQRIGQIITAELSFRSLRGLVMSLYRERSGEDGDFKTLQELMKRADELEGTRNQITHSIWATGDTRDIVTRIKTTAKEKRGLQFDFEDVSAEYLNAVAQEIQTLAEDIQRFSLKMLGFIGEE